MDNNNYYYEDHSSVPFHNRSRRPRSNAANTVLILTGAILVCVLSAVISSVVSGQKIRQAQQPVQNVIIYRSDSEHPHGDLDGEPMNVAEVANNVRDSIVEIHTAPSQTGSGVIITDCGYILTNFETVAQASSISVTLSDGTVCNAYLQGCDEKTDIAIIKLDGVCNGLIPAVLGDSDKLALGETVIAMGNVSSPPGLYVKDGIISGQERKMNVNNLNMTLLFTSIPADPGSSVFNRYGELVGLINVKYPEMGLGLAIPVSVAGYVAEAIITRGFVPGRVDTEAVQLYDIRPGSTYPIPMYDRGAGLYVKENYQNFQEYDYIVSVEGRYIANKTDWRKALTNYDAGDIITVVVNRRGSDQPIEVEFTLPEKLYP
jgi:serine protease Do